MVWNKLPKPLNHFSRLFAPCNNSVKTIICLWQYFLAGRHEPGEFASHGNIAMSGKGHFCLQILSTGVEYPNRFDLVLVNWIKSALCDRS